MDRDKLIRELRGVLDLNLYEAKVYLSILAYAPIELKDVYRKSEIPQSRAYDTIISLKKRGLINSFNKDKKEFYRPLDPKTSLNAYITQLKWNNEKEIENERIIFENKIKRMKNEFSEIINQKEERSKKLFSILQNIKSKNLIHEEELFQSIKGESNLVNYISDRVNSSKEIIKNVSLPPYLPEALIWENLVSKIKKGLKYLHIAYSGLIFEWGVWRIKEDINLGVNFRFLPKKEIKHKFYIFDNDLCFIRIKDPITDIHTDHCVVIKDPNWINDYQEKFNNFWDISLPFEELERQINIKKSEIFKKLDKEECIILNRIIERGKYATLNDLDLGEIEKRLNSLKRKNLIIPFDKSVLGYIANIGLFLGKEHSF